MNRITLPSLPIAVGCFFASAVATLLLVACGGGGSTAASDAAVVASATIPATPARFGQPLVVTVSGSHLDGALAVASSLCNDATLLSAPPNVSSATTAYFQCTISGVGSGQVVVSRVSDGSILATVPLTVLAPQVTLSLDNGAGVSGTMFLTLSPDKAPRTVANFLSYVNSGFYAGTIIHRVAPGFVVQGGGYVPPAGAGLPTLKATQAPIAFETTGLSNLQWTIAMARTSDPDSATSQFFINLADNSASLDSSALTGVGYAVFGTVSGGTSAVTAVVGAPCVAIPFFLPTGECTPQPYMVVISATQSQ